MVGEELSFDSTAGAGRNLLLTENTFVPEVGGHRTTSRIEQETPPSFRIIFSPTGSQFGSSSPTREEQEKRKGRPPNLFRGSSLQQRRSTGLQDGRVKPLPGGVPRPDVTEASRLVHRPRIRCPFPRPVRSICYRIYKAYSFLVLSLVIWVLGLVQGHVGLHGNDIADGDVLAKVMLVIQRGIRRIRCKESPTPTCLSVVVVV